MKFAVNYSPLLADLVSEKLISVDYFKCPAWPDLLPQARKTKPIYIHFPLSIGYGQGKVIDEETHQPADLERFARMMEETGTPYINTHFIAPVENYREMDRDSRNPRDIRRMLDGALRDLDPLINRFGAERVLIENIINEHNWLTACALPEVISTLLEESGCGFLFDLSHARLAADNLGIDAHDYITSLPMRRMRECHITGLRLLEGSLLEMILALGDPNGMAANQAGKRVDHLPMEDPDWLEFEWLLGNIGAQKFCAPWVISFEYGGVGQFWEQVTKRDVYLNQLPRMARMIREANQG